MSKNRNNYFFMSLYMSLQTAMVDLMAFWNFMDQIMFGDPVING